MDAKPFGATFAWQHSVASGCLAGPGLHERLLDIGCEELPPAARRAPLGLAFAVRDRPTGFTPVVLLTALRADDGRRLGKQLPDLAQFVRDVQRIDPRSRLIGLDEAVHERVEARKRFFHGCR